MTNDTPQDAETILREIHTMVTKLNENAPSEPPASGPRRKPGPNIVSGDILRSVVENQPISTGDIKEETGQNSTTPLHRLYCSFLVNRKKTAGQQGYVYTATTWGEQVVESWDQQQDLTVTEPSPDPWDESDLPRVKWHIVKSISNIDNATSAKVMADLEGLDAPESSISGMMSMLFNDGYTDRTPDTPYVYWLTDSGKAQLE